MLVSCIAPFLEHQIEGTDDKPKSGAFDMYGGDDDYGDYGPDYGSDDDYCTEDVGKAKNAF